MVLDILATAPKNASIISVSQNDNRDYCQQPQEQAINAQEGSNMGTLLRAVNSVANAVAANFPNIQVDTLAYQGTQTSPKITVPAPNVVIRLCRYNTTLLNPFPSLPLSLIFSPREFNYPKESQESHRNDS